MNSNKKFLAIAEQTLDVGIVKVVDLRGSGLAFEGRPRKIMFHTELGKSHYTQLAFFLKDDNKYLAAMTNTCDLVVFEWDKAKMKVSIKVNFLNKPTGMFFNPLEKGSDYVYIIIII